MSGNEESRAPVGASVACLALAMLVISPVAVGQAPEFRPAAFSFDNRLNAIEIAPGDLARDETTAAVRCQGFVETDGRLTDYHCITDRFYLDDDYYSDRKVLTAVIDAVPEQSFQPAAIDGQPVRVLLSFSVFFDCSETTCQAIAVPNHGYHLQEFGFNYSAPQPIIPDDHWYQGFDYKIAWTRDWMPKVSKFDNWKGWDRIPFTLSAEVRADGAAQGACLYWFKRVLNMGLRNTSQTLEEARDSLTTVRFIPGFVGGDPVPMRMYETSILHDDSSRGAGPYPQTDCPTAD